MDQGWIAAQDELVDQQELVEFRKLWIVKIHPAENSANDFVLKSFVSTSQVGGEKIC